MKMTRLLKKKKHLFKIKYPLEVQCGFFLMKRTLARIRHTTGRTTYGWLWVMKIKCCVHTIVFGVVSSDGHVCFHVSLKKVWEWTRICTKTFCGWQSSLGSKKSLQVDHTRSNKILHHHIQPRKFGGSRITFLTKLTQLQSSWLLCMENGWKDHCL